MPKIICSHCAQQLEVADEPVNSTNHCPNCRKQLQNSSPAEQNSGNCEASAPPPPPVQPPSATKTYLGKVLLIVAGLYLIMLIFRLSSYFDGTGINELGFTVTILEIMVVSGIAAIALFARQRAGSLSAFKTRFHSAHWRGLAIILIATAALTPFAQLTCKNNANDQAKSKGEDFKEFASWLEGQLYNQKTFGSTTTQAGNSSECQSHGDSKESGELNQCRKLMQEYLEEQQKLQDEYCQNMQNDGIDRLLDAERLQQDAGFVQSRQMLAKFKHRALETRQKALDIVTNFPDRIKKYNFSDTVNKSLLKGYQNGANYSLPLLRQSWDLELAMLGHMEALIDHLEATANRWRGEQATLIFNKQDDADRFNAIMAKWQQCEDRQNKLNEQSLQRAASKLEEIKRRL